MKYYFTLFILLIVILFSNCSLQKRHYRHGYNISINKDLNERNLTNSNLNKQFNDAISINNEIPDLYNSKVSFLGLKDINEFTDDSCDIIKLKNDKVISAKVTEINNYEIHYKRCDTKGVWKTEMKIARDKVASIKYKNGVSEIINPPNTTSTITLNSPIITSTNNCYDVIKTKTRIIIGYITEINSQVILYDSLSSNGQLKKSSIKKRSVTNIEFCGGTKITNKDLKEVNTIINKKEEMTDSTFWSKYHYDIIYLKNKNNAGSEEIKGFISQIGTDSIKYIPYNDSQEREIIIRSNNVKNIKMYNKEVISNYELKQLDKKVDSNIEIQRYAKSMERKEPLAKKLANQALVYGIIAFLLPIIGIPFGIKAMKSSKNANKIIATTPELKKHKAKIILGQLFGIISFGLSGIVLVVGILYILFRVIGFSIWL